MNQWQIFREGLTLATVLGLAWSLLVAGHALGLN